MVRCVLLWVAVVLVPVDRSFCQSPADIDQRLVSLDQIWAYDMPGARDVCELEPDNFGEQTRTLPDAERISLSKDSLTQQIRRAIKYSVPRSTDAKPGFAVLGRGLEALRAAYQVLVRGESIQATFPEDAEVSLVFFSHLAGSYVRLENAERRGNKIEIRYRFVAHRTKDATNHFALIPLGKLPPGKYQVDIVQLPIEHPNRTAEMAYLPPDKARRIVCQPFSFTVTAR